MLPDENFFLPDNRSISYKVKYYSMMSQINRKEMK